jgi:hypothetical protein
MPPDRWRSSEAGEIELEPLALALGRDPVVQVHQARAARRDGLVRERAPEDVEGAQARLPGDVVLLRGVDRGVLDEQRLGRGEFRGVFRPDGVDEVVVQRHRQAIEHADGTRSVDGDTAGPAVVDVLLEVRCESFFAVVPNGVEEPREMARQVRAERRGLERAFAARVEEQVGVPVAVPAGDAVAAEE